MANPEQKRFLHPLRKLDILAYAILVFSLFGFLGNVMLDYNWGTNPISNSWALMYSETLRQLIPFPIGYYGVGAAVYLMLFLLSFSTLNRDQPKRKNLLETLRLASASVLLFELGLYYFVPYFMDLWVISAFSNSPLRYFTNWDLLSTAFATLLLSQVLLRRESRRH